VGLELHHQLLGEIRKIESLDFHKERLESQIHDLRAIIENDSPDSLIRSVQQDTEFLQGYVEEKLPNEIEPSPTTVYTALRLAEEYEPRCRGDLEPLRDRVSTSNSLRSYRPTLSI